jgi:hypothetical protein
VLRDVTVKTATSWAGSVGQGGRQYPRAYNLTYPAGGAQVNGVIQGAGQTPIRPVLRIYGPITTPKVSFVTVGPPAHNFQVWLVPGYVIALNHYVQVDCLNRTVTADTGASILGVLDWTNTVWPVLPNQPDQTTMVLQGDASGPISSSTQVQATWQDGFLT